MRSLQKLAALDASFHNHFKHERHFVDRQTCKASRSAALDEWKNLMA